MQNPLSFNLYTEQKQMTFIRGVQSQEQWLTLSGEGQNGTSYWASYVLVPDLGSV